MFCPNCGTEIGEGALFCRNCGTKIAAPSRVPEAAVPPAAAAAVQTAETAEKQAAEAVKNQAVEVAEKPAAEADAVVKEAEAAVQKAADVPERPEVLEELTPDPAGPADDELGKILNGEAEGPAPYRPDVPPIPPIQPETAGNAPEPPVQYQQGPWAIEPPVRPVNIPPEESESSAGRIILSVVLALLLFICCTLFIVLHSVRKGLSEDSLSAAIDGMNLSGMTLVTEEYGEITLDKYLEKENPDLVEIGDIRGKQITKLLSRNYVKKELKSIATHYTDYFVRGKRLEPISREGLVDFLEKNADKMYEDSEGAFVFVGKETDKPYGIYYYIEEKDIDDMFDEWGTDELDVGFMKRTLGVNPSLIKTFLSGGMEIGILVLSVLILAGLILLNLKKLHQGFYFGGGALIASGIAGMTAGFVIRSVASNSGFSIAEELAEIFRQPFLRTGLTVLIAGFVLIVPVGIAVMLITKKLKARKVQAQRPVY